MSDDRRTQHAIDHYRAHLYRRMDHARSLRGQYLRSLAGTIWSRTVKLLRHTGEPQAAPSRRVPIAQP